MFDRRQALQMAMLGGLSPLTRAAGLRLPGDDPPPVRLTPFVQPLPLPPAPTQVDPFMPSAEALRHLDDLRPFVPKARFHEIVQEEALVSLHPELPPTPVWRYRDTRVPESSPYLAGPTFQVRFGDPQVIRHLNRLPTNHVGFGVNHTTVHFHGGHVLPVFDGFPENVEDIPTKMVIEPGEQFDYVYAMQDVGSTRGKPDKDERPATMWYHDHLLDFTGPNVMRGLAGVYLVFDELDTGDETTGLRLPSGPFDVPLVIQDKRLRPDGTMIYEPGDFNGFLGDQMLVNGAIQPYLDVKRRKYRLRFLNGANARMFMLRITDEDGGNTVPFDAIGTDGGLLSAPERGMREALVSMGDRLDVVVDFSDFQPGQRLYLMNFLEQDSGRGPEGDFEEPGLLGRDQAVRLLEFRVQGGEVRDRSQVPDVLRPVRPVPQDLLDAAERRHFEFERTGGAWAVNGEFIDIEHPLAKVPPETPQIWTFENGGGGWWHPIHVHIERMRILRRNGKTPGPLERDGNTKRDMVNLAGGDEVEVYLNFRDYTGASVFHCHNIEHEDHFMMARFDIGGAASSVIGR